MTEDYPYFDKAELTLEVIVISTLLPKKAISLYSFSQ